MCFTFFVAVQTQLSNVTTTIKQLILVGLLWTSIYFWIYSHKIATLVMLKDLLSFCPKIVNIIQH